MRYKSDNERQYKMNAGQFPSRHFFCLLFFCFSVFPFFGFLVKPAAASVTLRVVAVNPSEDSEQAVPIKVYLPVEVKPEDIIYKGDLEIAYDTQQGSYYVFGDYELKPLETLEKEIEIKDIWLVEDAEIASLRKEAKDMFSVFDKTPYADKAQVLSKGIEKKLKEIEDMQTGLAANPAQHISNYRYCLSVIKSVKSGLLEAKDLAKDIAPKGLGGLTWKIIVFIIGFLGILSLGFYIIWQKQAGEQKS